MRRGGGAILTDGEVMALKPQPRRYEVMYILRGELPEERYTEVVSRYEQFIKDRGGEVLDLDEWGRRKFAYPIQHQNEGYYVLMTLDAAPRVLEELKNRMQLDEDVLRYQAVRLEAKAETEDLQEQGVAV